MTTLIVAPCSLLAQEKKSSGVNAFFDKLRRLEKGEDTTVVSVLHLGDSHIQAGHLSAAVRRPMQVRFGNAGRGWVSPLKLSKTNEPNDYFITSPIKEWIAGRVIQREKKTSIGPGGMGIKATGRKVDFTITIAPENGAGYSFDKVVAYRSADASELTTAQPNTIYSGHSSDSLMPYMRTDTFRFADKIDTLRLRGTSASGDNTYYGFNLTSGHRGLLYHSIGINGAMYVQYTDEKYVEKLATLQPDLVIISLGTNETFGRAFRQGEFEEQVRSFVALLKRYVPNASILLTTPPEVYKRIVQNKKRIYVRNQNSEKAAAAIKKVAEEEGLECFDLFAELGGKGSCVKLHNNGDLARDRIHFTKEGYTKQGTMLYKYIIDHYEKYISE
jgi:lysophospholipase L1-like esterase